MNRQRLLLLAGVGLAGLGLLALVAPGVLGLDLGETVLTLVALLALVQTLRVVRARRRTEFREATTADPELVRPVEPPGSQFQEALGQFRRRPHTYYRESRRTALKSAAIAVLTRYDNRSEADARRRLEEGTWTDDPYASAFLNGERDLALPTTVRLRAALSGSSLYERCVGRSVDAIASVAGVSAVDDGERTRADGHHSVNGVTHDTRPRRETSEDGLLSRRETGRWHGISVVALGSVGVGVLLEQPGVLLVGVVGLWYAAYARVHDVSGGGLSVERSLDGEEPSPGEPVDVTVTVRNDGERLLPDVRLVDGVPGALSVVAGSPRLGTALRPGEAAEFTYTVEARRGVHEFDPLVALVRNVPGAAEYERTVTPERPTAITCVPQLEPLSVSMPLRAANTRYAGTEATASGGDGTEFYATRLYQPGDEKSRIDWNRKAKTGELSTLLFREERMTTVVLVVDVDGTAYAAPEPHAGHAVDRSVEAAGQVFATLEGEGHLVGVAALGRADCWLAPGTGTTHRARVQDLLATHPALASVPPEGRENPIRARRLLRGRLPAGAQLVVFSPLGRPSVVRAIRGFEAAGYPVTVVSPDATADGTPGQRLARVGRRVHVTDLRGDGIPVVDWSWDDPLAMALAAFSERRGARR